jgi:hypothetical protein
MNDKRPPTYPRAALLLLPMALAGGRIEEARAAQAPTSTCRPVIPAVVHHVPNACTKTDFLGEPFLVNRRLTPIENGTVPCVEVDTMEATRCLFRTGLEVSRISRSLPPPSGPWLQDPEGREYAVVGQPVTRDGSLASGSFIVGTVPDGDGSVPCVGASGQDSAGVVAGVTLAVTCDVETPGAQTNASGQPLRNWVTRAVGTSTLIHPDSGAELVAVDPDRLVAWWTGEGAALNDAGGVERDGTSVYYGDSGRCHLIVSNSVEVPAAKRPSTRSYPKPGVVNINTPIRWQVANPYVTIANDPPADPRVGPPPTASFTFSPGLTTLWLDASSSTGDIVRYVWDFDWTPETPDRVTESPTIAVPLFVEGPRNTGWIKLAVVSRNRHLVTNSQQIRFVSRIPNHRVRPRPVPQPN